MSTKYQHIVPVSHLKHFAIDNKVVVTNKHNGKHYGQNISEIGGMNYIYDYDTSDPDSLEYYFQIDEKKYGKMINNLLTKGEDVPSKDLIEYVCVLNNRSYWIIDAVVAYTKDFYCIPKNDDLSFLNDKEQEVFVNKFRTTIKIFYQERSKYLLGENVDKFDAKIMDITDLEKRFITADMPLYLQNIYGSKSELEETIYNNPNYINWYCPISPTKCIVIARKDQFEKTFMKTIMNGDSGRIIDELNCNLMYNCHQNTYSDYYPEKIFNVFKTMKPNPLQKMSEDNIAMICKLSKKFHKK